MTIGISRSWIVVFLVVSLVYQNLQQSFDSTPFERTPTETIDSATDGNTSSLPTSDDDALKLDWKSSIDKSTDILYRDAPTSVREFWQSQSPPTIYIYDTLPADFSSVDKISTCIDETFLGQNATEVWVESKRNCRWKPTVCEDFNPPSKPKQQKFFSYRQNYNMDVAYLDKFYRYPFRTKDPSQADVFVVPYPHKSHCLCHQDFRKYSAACVVPFEDIEENVMEKLSLMSNTSLINAKQRHLFFHGADWLQQNGMFRKASSSSISLSLGPVLPCQAEGPCGDVTLPYVSTDLEYQPFLSSTPSEDSLGSSFLNRSYFVGAALGSPRGLQLRSQFLDDWKHWIGDSIGGKPNHVLNLGAKRRGEISQTFKELYRNSTICLVLPGDGCAQKRFFDAILNGCIPLVPVYPSNEDAWPISFHYQKCSTRITYPFAKGTFQEPQAGFEMLDLVATYNGTCGFPCLQTALTELASDSKALQSKHNRLREYGDLMKFGLDDRSNSIPDAFSALLVRLRQYTWDLHGKASP